MSKIGSQNVIGLRLGDQEIARAYLGGGIVFGSAPGPAACIITASVDPAGSGTVSGAWQYNEGETVTLRAVPGDGYQFSGWRENGETVSAEPEYSFTATEDRSFVARFEAKASRMPEGYTEVEYVQMVSASTPISDVNTGINCAWTGRYVLDVEFGETSRSNDYLYASRSGASTTGLYFNNSFTSTSLTYQIGQTTMTRSLNFGSTAGRHTVEIDIQNAVIKFDSSSQEIKVSTNVPNNPLRLEAPLTPIKWYSVKLYNNNNIQSDLVPCKNPSGVAGFYDLVRETFYTLTGTTGTITAGPAV